MPSFLRRALRRACVAACAALPVPLLAQETGERVRTATAVRMRAPVSLDGRMDEPAWRDAPLVGDFVQRSPVEHAAPSQRTEVRVLYDDDALYVGASMLDTHPDSIIALLGRRDSSSPGDEFYVQLDSYMDRRTAFVFSVTPAGVKVDQLIVNGSQIDRGWDAVWDVATRRDSLGWHAEFRIPFSQLRFATTAGGGELRWRVNFIRWIARRNEDVQWSLIPQTSTDWVRYYGELRGLRVARGPRRVEVQPYVATRLRSEPTTGPLHSGERGAAATLGADVKVGVGSAFTLSAALNPDFGQVEADPSLVNLSAFEAFIPERRPFFVEGAEIFRFSTREWYDEGDLFYSRRVGRSPRGDLPANARDAVVPTASTLLGAAKLSGKTPSGWSVGVMGALTGEERAHFRDATGSPGSAVVEPATGFGVARVIRDFRGGASALGAIVLGTSRRMDDEPSLAELPRTGYAAGIDGRHRFPGHVEASGWVAGTRVEGSATAIAATQRSAAHRFDRPDASHLRFDSTRTSLEGAAAGVRVARVGGNWRWALSGRTFSPEFEANDLGYQPRADQWVQHATLGYERPGMRGRLRSGYLYLNQYARWSWGGERFLTQVDAIGNAELRGGGRINGYATRDLESLSTDVLRGGPAVVAPPATTVSLRAASDSRRRVTGAVRGTFRREDATGGRSATVAPELSVRPSTRAELVLRPSYTRNVNPWQYVARVQRGTGAEYVVGELRQTTASLTARVNYTFTPEMTLQFYAQPFLSAGVYSSFRELDSPRARRLDGRFRPLGAAVREGSGGIEVDADGDGTAEYRFGRPDFNRRDLNGSAVFRWEYRPGSTLFLVWNHTRDASAADGGFRLRREADALFTADARNVLQVKVTHWFGS